MHRESVLLLVAGLFLVGCGDSGRDLSDEALRNMVGGELKETVPVSGKVMVNGEPGNKITIRAYTPESGTEPAAECETQPDGTYCWMTYAECDGIPPGEYRLAFSRAARQKPGQKDRLGGKYLNPNENDFVLTVVSGEPQENVDYELTVD